VSELDDALESMIRRVVREEAAEQAAQIVAQVREALARNSGLERTALSIDEAAERLGVSAKTISRRITAGELEKHLIGSRVVVMVDDLDRLTARAS
jgi:excisionase family DNA binding protein